MVAEKQIKTGVFRGGLVRKRKRSKSRIIINAFKATRIQYDSKKGVCSQKPAGEEKETAENEKKKSGVFAYRSTNSEKN
jgi:hypothetical protein